MGLTSVLGGKNFKQMTKVQQLQTRAAELPEHLAAEVLDFLEFVKAKRAGQNMHEIDSANRLRGTFKGRLSTSSDFAAKKSDEIRLEN